jgi:spore germination protein
VKKMRKYRVSSVAAAVLLTAVLSGTAVFGFLQADRYRRELQNSYQRALQDLSDHVGNITTVLDKAPYANTATEQTGLAAKLQREAGMAQASLAALPVGDSSLESVSKFISQVGDFSATLSRNVSAGGGVTAEDLETIGSLESYAQKLSSDLQSLRPDFSGAETFHDSVQETADDFSDFPSLIYDGPFSDHVVNRSPKLTEGAEELPQGNAETIAARFLGTDQTLLTHTQDTEGNLPTYNFSANGDEITIAVTKAGGYVTDMANSRSVESRSMNYAEASEIAASFLESRGIRSTKESYYVILDNVCLMNYAYVQDGVICYPDLLKVGVALDDGEIVRFQSTGWVMNHCSRTLTPKLSEAEARAQVSPSLSVQDSRLVLIPTKTGGEALAWEFLCTGAKDDRVLVYLDAETGFEDDILILRETDQGVLTR